MPQPLTGYGVNWMEWELDVPDPFPHNRINQPSAGVYQLIPEQAKHQAKHHVGITFLPNDLFSTFEGPMVLPTRTVPRNILAFPGDNTAPQPTQGIT